MASMPILKPEKKMIEAFLRAWSYNVFYELSMQYPEHKKETKKLFEMAMKDEAPSVKSRIKNIMKKGF